MSTKFFTNEEGRTLMEKIAGIFAHKNIHFFDVLVGYYPSDFADCTGEDVLQLDAVTKVRFAAKVREHKEGPWHKLAKKFGPELAVTKN